MANSSVWVALASPNAPDGGIPYIDPSEDTPTIDVVNFKWDSTLKYLYAAGGIKTDYSIAGASGAITIDKAAGVVQFAAAAQSLVLTNSKIKDASTIIIAQILTDDATAKSVAITAAAGSATFKLNANTTGIVKVAFLVLRNSET